MQMPLPLLLFVWLDEHKLRFKKQTRCRPASASKDSNLHQLDLCQRVLFHPSLQQNEVELLFEEVWRYIEAIWPALHGEMKQLMSGVDFCLRSRRVRLPEQKDKGGLGDNMFLGALDEETQTLLEYIISPYFKHPSQLKMHRSKAYLFGPEGGTAGHTLHIHQYISLTKPFSAILESNDSWDQYSAVGYTQWQCQ